MEKYDLIVLGGGPAGYHGAHQAVIKGMKTLLIEKRKLGGVCLNEGCIPTKTFLHSAKIYHYALHSNSVGVTTEEASFHHAEVLERKNQVTQKLGNSVHIKLKSSGVNICDGYAQILERQADGFRIQVGEEVFLGARLLLATGASSVIPPIPCLPEAYNDGIVITSRELLDIPEIPKSLIIIGGGIIGLEMADYFSAVGCQVTVIEMQDQIGGAIDREVAQKFLKVMKKKGIFFKLKAKVHRIENHKVIYEQEGQTFSIEGENILVSVGRKPNIEGWGLEEIGVEIDRSAIKTDEFGRTNIPNVYAAGDVNGKSMLAHTAYREAEVCINHMMGQKDIMRYHAIPSVVYTTPEVAFVGETEESAKNKGIEVENITLPLIYSGRYVVEMGDPDGFIKILIDRKFDKIVGLHIIGNYASEIVYGAAMMIETELTVRDIEELVFPHPSISEVIKEAVMKYSSSNKKRRVNYA